MMSDIFHFSPDVAPTGDSSSAGKQQKLRVIDGVHVARGYNDATLCRKSKRTIINVIMGIFVHLFKEHLYFKTLQVSS